MSHTENPWPWSELGLDGRPDDPKDLRRAYAKKLKSIDADVDVQAFEQLRQAYEHARRLTGDAPRRQAIVREVQTQTIQQPSLQQGDLKPQVSDEAPPPLEDKNTDQHPSKPIASPWNKKDFSNSQTVLDEAQKLISDGSVNAKSWLPLINADALSDPHVSHQFQWMLQDFLGKSPLSGSRLETRLELFVAIDDRFGWVSDGVGFLRQFPNSFELQSQMSDDLRQEECRLKRKKQVFRAPKELKVKPLPVWVWGLTFGVWFFLLGG